MDLYSTFENVNDSIWNEILMTNKYETTGIFLKIKSCFNCKEEGSSSLLVLKTKQFCTKNFQAPRKIYDYSKVSNNVGLYLLRCMRICSNKACKADEKWKDLINCFNVLILNPTKINSFVVKSSKRRGSKIRLR